MADEALASVTAGPDNVDEPEDDNEPAVVEFAAVERKRHDLAYIAWSYSGIPIDGHLSVEVEGQNVLSIDITNGGPGSMQFANPLRCRKDAGVTVTLAPGGVGVKGKLNVYKFTR